MKKNLMPIARPGSVRMAVLAPLLVCALAFNLPAAETPPEFMTYQGFVVDGNGTALGNDEAENFEVIFRIWTEQTGGELLWAEQQTVTIDKGYLSVLLGEGAEISGEPRPSLSSIYSGPTASDRYIGITVKIDNADVDILPRLKLVASPYSYLASKANDAGTLDGYDWDTPPGGVFVPVGGVIMWWGDVAGIPSGFELCNGAVPTTPGALLSGNKPDLRDRFVKGASSSDTTKASLNLGGAHTINQRDTGSTALTWNQMPNHNHYISLSSSSDSHAHNYYDYYWQDTGNDDLYGTPAGDGSGQRLQAYRSTFTDTHNHNVVGYTYTSGDSSGHTHTIGAHDNRPAFMELFYIIRVK